MLCRDYDSIDTHRTPLLVLDSYLALAIRAQIGHRAIAAPRFATHLRELTSKLVRKIDRHRHIFRGLVAGKTNHHTLIASADTIQLTFAESHNTICFCFQSLTYAQVDICRLLANGSR